MAQTQSLAKYNPGKATDIQHVVLFPVLCDTKPLGL